MAYLDPDAGFSALKTSVEETLKDMFPIKGNKRTLRVKSVKVQDNKHVDDIRSQLEAKENDKSWDVPVNAELELVDNATGKVIDTQKKRLMNLPKVTNRLGYIVDGKEYQVDSLWKLRPGPYSRINEKGGLETRFNLKGRNAFHVDFSPEKSKFTVRHGSSNYALYPFMKALGVSDSELEKKWGPEILEANKNVNVDKELARFHSKVARKDEAKKAPQEFIREFFTAGEMDPRVTEQTLGIKKNFVDGDAIARSTEKLLKINKGESDTDDRDDLAFKDLHSMEDFAKEALQQKSRDIFRKIGAGLNKRDKIKDIVSSDVFTKPIKNIFTETSLGNHPEQTNPVEILNNATKTTFLGEFGGIKSENTIPADTKLVNPSHFGFLDPLITPESGRAGVSLHLASGVQKRNNKVVTTLYNVKTGKYEEVDPVKAMKANVVMPDQVEWKNGKPIPRGKSVRLSSAGNEIEEKPFSQADYVIPTPVQIFGASTNQVPFMATTSPNRTTMAGRHMSQAIPLLHREARLTESVIRKDAHGKSISDYLGKVASHISPVTGEVVGLKDDAVVIKDTKGKKHEVQIYKDFPVNDERSYITSIPTVKVGDKVKEADTIADSNFTKNGKIALGTNLLTASMPWKGRNFEDGVVISEDAAKKLSSLHMHRKSLALDKGVELDNVNRFIANSPNSLNKEQLNKLDKTGVIKPGMRVLPGDTLIAAVRRQDADHEDQARRRRMGKNALKLYRPEAVTWESETEGVVSKVVRKGKKVEVQVKTVEPATIGDKIAGSYGDKGIITEIVPTGKMPKTSDGKAVDLLVNPAGIPGRINLGQVLEAATNKIAEKTGKPYIVQNFDGEKDITRKVKEDLKKHGLTDKEDLVDPTTGQKIKAVLTGPRYIHKLKHQVVKKETARAGGPGYVYDAQKIPKRGGPKGAQSLEQLSLYSLLAHGAKTNIREAVTYKADAGNNDAIWNAIQTGTPLPPPRPTFAYEKFAGMLKTMGVNMEKQGNSLILQPLTDKQTLEMSNGELKDAGKMLEARRWLPEKSGLYDEKATGGLEGTKWSHIALQQRMPNPVFEKSITSLIGVKEKDFDRLMKGELAVNPKTKELVSSEEEGALSGGKAVEHLLSQVNIQKELTGALDALKNKKLKGKRLNDLNKKVKYLRVLSENNLSPVDAYMQKTVPVMPPSMRPPAVLPNGSFIKDDINQHYKNIALANRSIKEAPTVKDLPEVEAKRQADLYDAMKGLVGLGGMPGNTYKGIIDQIGGKGYGKEGERTGKPASGYFQDKLVKKRQDLSMRTTIVPEPELGLDEVGLPRDKALELYKPFVVKGLKQMGLSPLKAIDAVDKKTPQAYKILERAVQERPVLMKRDPVLHKYGIQAFNPKLVSGKAIKIHPLTCSGFNADFDGDQMAVFAPISQDAVQEARKMHPSNNLFSPATGKVMFAPTHESKLGLYMANREGKRKNAVYKTVGEAAKAAKDGKLEFTDVVTIGGEKTTLGRSLTALTLPKDMRRDVLRGKVSMDGKGQDALLTRLAKEHKGDYGKVVNDLKDLGNSYITANPLSIGLDDIMAEPSTRDKALKAADAQVSKIKSKGLSIREEMKETVRAYDAASSVVQEDLKRSLPNMKSNLVHMMNAGIKPNLDTLRQIKVAPLLMANSKGEVIPSPVRKAYSEGLDIGDYWTSMAGARKGIIQKVQAVRDPGYLTKQIMNTVMSNTIAADDCGTAKGISLPVDERDILDRFLATDVKAGRRTFKSGTLITPSVRDSLRNNKVGKVVVRSPLRCEHGEGLCSKCHGLDEDGKLPEFGRNVGIISGQSIGERATQLSMKSFHSGGVVPVGKATGGGGNVVDRFDRVQQLLRLPQKVPDSIALAKQTGKVTKIHKNPAGGHDVYVGTQKHYISPVNGAPLLLSKNGERPLRVGDQVNRGAPLGKGPINPSEMLPLAGINKVQNYMSSELYDLYKGEGIRRRNVEVVVKALTNTSQVKDPGGSPEYIHGDMVPTSRLQAKNKELLRAGKPPIEAVPVLKGVGMAPLSIQQDFLANLNHQRLKDTVIDAANQGWKSDLHGKHPIPGIVYGAEFGKGKVY